MTERERTYSKSSKTERKTSSKSSKTERGVCEALTLTSYHLSGQRDHRAVELSRREEEEGGMRMMEVIVMVVVILGVCCERKGVEARTPETLSNFQDLHQCDVERTLISRPETLEDLAEAVRSSERVQAVGSGHSWNEPFFCAAQAPSGADGVNVAMLSLVDNDAADLSRYILVNETDMSVVVAAGVEQVRRKT